MYKIGYNNILASDSLKEIIASIVNKISSNHLVFV